jgi:hypothetical protein
MQAQGQQVREPEHGRSRLRGSLAAVGVGKHRGEAGVMVIGSLGAKGAGASSEATAEAVQANIVAAGYGH